MKTSVARGRWQQITGALAAQWGQVTGKPLIVFAARHRQRVGRLNASTSAARTEIGREIDRIRRRSRECAQAA